MAYLKIAVVTGFAASLFVAGFTAAPAYAISAQQDTVTTKIDLRDLETQRGIEKTYAALTRKAEISCTVPGQQPLEMRIFARDCTAKLLAEFIEDVDNTQLSAYHVKMTSE